MNLTWVQIPAGTLILCLSLENLANPSQLPFKIILVIIAISGLL